MQLGIIIVDHGSRRDESNRVVVETASAFARRFETLFDVVEPAHMELADPSIAQAYARCVARGATRIVVVPFFLGPGKHWSEDIPRLTAAAATNYPGTHAIVADPLGPDDLLLQLLARRVNLCLERAQAVLKRETIEPETSHVG
jgi:sirohydrochlorin ferrochelatase